jgi:hypothetical protein
MSATKSRSNANMVETVKTKIPVGIWIVLIIVIIIAIIFIILWIIKKTKCTATICSTALSGIGQTCTTTSNCASGLTCSSGACACLAPLPPTNLTMTSPSAGSVTITFTPVNIIPYSYNVILFNQNDGTNAIRYVNVNSTAIATITVDYTAQLTAGTYTVKVIPISPTCSSDDNMTEVTGVVVA